MRSRACRTRARRNRGAEGATNTGPKGVLRDQQLRAAQESAARSAAVHATNRRMESLALSSETYTQQVERERREAALRLQHELDDDQHTVSREAIAIFKPRSVVAKHGLPS